MSDDPYQDYEDRMLLEEHATHPERFHRTNQMKQRFIDHIQSIADPALRATCNEILLLDKFLTWPASLSHHHAYEGGLLAHTVEVADLAKSISASYGLVPHANPDTMQAFEDILITAALWHDVLKAEEYRIESWTTEMYEYNKTVPGARFLLAPGQELDVVRVWVGTPYVHQIHHIQGSAIEFSIFATDHGVPRATIDAIQHCILAHHGRKEWGSPVEPQTLEALILHQADMLSSRYGVTKDGKP